MITFIHPDLRLCDLVLIDPSLIPVINRFGIKLGLGDKSIAQLCEQYKLDSTFFTAILNTYIHKDYIPSDKFNTEYASQIIDYLRKTNASYERFLLPNIERHLNSFIERSDPSNANLLLLQKFFNLFKKELMERIADDNNIAFPKLKELSSLSKAPSVALDCPSQQDDSLAEKLADIKRIMIMHINGDYDENLCYAVLVAICNLEKDINNHNRIRNKILIPFTEALNSVQ